jgi:hypothetical protein
MVQVSLKSVSAPALAALRHPALRHHISARRHQTQSRANMLQGQLNISTIEI